MKIIFCIYALIYVLMTFGGFVFWAGISICCEIKFGKIHKSVPEA